MEGGGGRRRICMGVDIEEGSPRGSKARYSIVIVGQDGIVVYKTQGASLARLVRLAWEYRPDCIAVDNVYELAENPRDLARLASLLPPETRLVQVTARPEGGFEAMRVVAEKLGELGKSRLTPARTAYAAALAALLGEGAEVRFSEEKTVIVVSKGRNPKGGGMSHDRYMRRIRASVMQAARRIEAALDEAGLDYDVTIRKGEGGYESAVFTVYAPRSSLEGVVRPHKGIDYTVTVKTVLGGRVTFQPGGVAPQRPVIVGLDPGTTTGIAILDLAGNVLFVGSRRGFDRGTLLSVIERYGRPVVVAVDVSKPPEAARKLAAQFNADVYAPPQDLSVGEKSELAQRALGSTPSSTHERDALAAAYKAWLALKSKLARIQSYLDKIGVEVDADSVVEGVLKGLTLAEAVEKEIEKIMGQIGGGEARGRAEGGKREPAAASAYAARIQELEAEKYALERALEKRDKRIAELEREVESLRRRLRTAALLPPEAASREAELRSRVESLEREIDELRKRIAELEGKARAAAGLIWMAARGEVLVARPLPSLTLSNIRAEERLRGPLRPGDVLYVANPGSYEGRAVEEVASVPVAAVLLDRLGGGLVSALEKALVPVLPLRDYYRGEYMGLVLVDGRVVEDAVRRREELERTRLASIDLERIVSEYRAERARRLRRRTRGA